MIDFASDAAAVNLSIQGAQVAIGLVDAPLLLTVPWESRGTILDRANRAPRASMGEQSAALLALSCMLGAPLLAALACGAPAIAAAGMVLLAVVGASVPARRRCYGIG